MELTDTRYDVDNGLAWITIDRPERLNAFRAQTVDELIELFTRAWSSRDVGVVCLTGAGAAPRKRPRDRRRPRVSRAGRHHDRGRARDLRPGRTEGRVVRRRFR